MVASSKFRRDVKKIEKRGYDIRKLEVAITLLASGEPLPKNYEDHKLQGKLKGFRDCHIEPDWVLVYRIEKENLILFLSRTGQHNDFLE